jgi:hypothetical protein
MLWSSSLLLLLASAEYALGSHGRHHAHRHRARHPVKPDIDMMEPWGMGWANPPAPAPVPVPEEVHTKIGTITKTVFEKCAPTNTGLTTKPLDFVPEPTQPQNTMSIPTHYDIHQSQTTSDEETEEIKETTIHIHMTTTITATVTITSPPVKVSAAVTAPASSSKSGSASVEARPTSDATKTDQAPKILPTLGQVPEQVPGDLTQILPGVATVIPVQLLNLGPVLPPDGLAAPTDLDWTSTPASGGFAKKGFGGQSSPSGSEIHYKGNVGQPWGSNIISVSPARAHLYKYVVRFTGSNTEPWTVTIWNKVGPDGKMDGWYGHSALTFILAPGETHYVAFDEDSEGAWGAAPGTNGLPTDDWGGYTSTWGEFTFGDGETNGWSGWDVSAIQAQVAHQDVQGMRICMADGKGCSIITPQAKKVVNAYIESKRHHGGIGGAAAPGPVRLVVDLDYQG